MERRTAGCVFKPLSQISEWQSDANELRRPSRPSGEESLQGCGVFCDNRAIQHTGNQGGRRFGVD